MTDYTPAAQAAMQEATGGFVYSSARVLVEKTASFAFPLGLFTDERMQMVRDYSEAHRFIETNDELRREIAEYWALYGYGYAEPFGCFISEGAPWNPDPNQLYVVVTADNAEIDDAEVEQ